MKISRRETVLSFVTLTAVLFGLTWYFVDKNLENWKSMQAEITQTERLIRVNKAAVEKNSSWKKELEVLQKDLTVFDSSDRSVSPDLLKLIKKISTRHKLDIMRTQPYPEKQIGDLFEMGINCTWEGSLEALVYFLAELQEQGSRYDVRQLNVTPKGSDLKGSMIIHCAYRRSAPESKKTPATEKQ